MASYRLQCTPNDAVATHVLWQGTERLGEIRRHELHTSLLYVGERGLWLRHDQGAAVAARGGSWFERLLAELRFTRSWSLHENEVVAAKAMRRWHWRPSRDVLMLWCGSGSEPLVARSSSVLGREFALHRGGSAAGRLRTTGFWRSQIELEGADLDAAGAALLMYVLDRVHGASRNSAGATVDGH